MLRKYKHFLIGFLVGALLFTFIPANAAVQEYILTKSNVKIIINGKEFTNKELPVLFMQPGYNYIPVATFREICDKIGVSFDWVGETNEIQIQTKGDEKRVEESRPIEGATIENIEKDGYNLIVVNGIEYVSIEEMHGKYKDEYCFNPLDGSKPLTRGITLIENATNQVLLRIPRRQIDIFNNKEYITLKYFVDTVLPLIEKEGN